MIDSSDLIRGLDNTQPWATSKGNSGLLYLWTKLWPSVFYNGFAEVHWKMLQTILSMYDPVYENKMDRQRYAVVHREAGKTTLLTFAWPATCLWLAGYQFYIRRDALGWEGSDLHDYDIIELPPLREDFILITSETATRAQQFVSNLKSEVESRRDLHSLLGDLRPKKLEEDDDDLAIAGRSGDILWRKSAFITHNERTSEKTIIVGIGSGQQTRGINVNNKRPTLVLVDDLYSLKNTKTETTRSNISTWFYSELGNTADTLRGKTLLAGTIMHTATVTHEVRSLTGWKGIVQSIIGLPELEVVISELKKDDRGVILIPDVATCKKREQSLKTLSWPERFSLRFILQKYEDYQRKERLKEFYNEFCNVAYDPADIRFLWENFSAIDLHYDRYDQEVVLSWEWEGLKWASNFEWYYGMDLASAEHAKADEFTLFRVALLKAVSRPDDRGKIIERVFPYVGYIEGGRGYDVLPSDNGRRRSMFGSLRNQLLQYPAESITIDAHATQSLVVGTIATEMRRNTPVLTGMVIPHEHTGTRKEDFILSVLEPLVQRYGRFFYNPACGERMKKTFDQLVGLGSGDHDDYPDGLAMAFLYARESSSLRGPLLSKAFVPSVPRNNSGRELFSSIERWETI